MSRLFVRTNIVVILAGIIVLLLFSCNQNKEQKTATQPEGTKSGIDLSGMQLRPGADASSFLAVGRARNRSAQPVHEITLRFVMEDVLASGASTTVAETVVVLKKDIAPRDSTEFSEPVVFKNVPPAKGRHEWNYAIVGVKAQ